MPSVPVINRRFARCVAFGVRTALGAANPARVRVCAAHFNLVRSAKRAAFNNFGHGVSSSLVVLHNYSSELTGENRRQLNSRGYMARTSQSRRAVVSAFAAARQTGLFCFRRAVASNSLGQLQALGLQREGSRVAWSMLQFALVTSSFPCGCRITRRCSGSLSAPAELCVRPHPAKGGSRGSRLCRQRNGTSFPPRLRSARRNPGTALAHSERCPPRFVQPIPGCSIGTRHRPALFSNRTCSPFPSPL